jgi:hypothetical protein
MQKVQLYVEGVELDLFNDEVIELTSTIKDVKDIGKVFTDYSQTFTVPASKTNNKIFKHYYNYNITGGAFDSRKKKSAQIHINYTPFKIGRIYLNSVKMRMNKAYAYELIFYGNTVSLKDLIGDDELSELSYLINFNHNYNESTVRDAFINGLDFNIDGSNKEEAIIYPLITTKKRLFYNSDNPVSSGFFDSSGNLYHNTNLTKQNVRGLEYTDLKPAIRLIHLIEAIESQYNIEFTRSVRKADGTDRKTFFDSDAFIGNDSTNYYGLYMWLNSNKGDLFEYDIEGQELISALSNFSALPGNYGNTSFSNEVMTVDISDLPLTSYVEGYNVRLFVYPDTSSSSTQYTISIVDNLTNQVLASRQGTGNLSVQINIDEDIRAIRGFRFVVSSTETIVYDTSNDPRVEFSTFDNDGDPVEVDQWESSDNSILTEVLMSQVFPQMKVIDFLTGLFKMFNLTAYYIDDYRDVNYGKIYVDTLDNFYLDCTNNPLKGLVDISDYLDVKQHTVDSVLPYTDIKFEYQETNVVLMENHFAKFNEVFGNSEYNVRELIRQKEGIYIDRGTKYEINLPFSHMKYERLYDLGESIPSGQTDDTSIQWGYCATGEFNADEDATPPTGDYDRTTISPLLFYAISEGTGSKEINWISTSPPTGIDTYWRASNSYDDGTPTYFNTVLNEIPVGIPPTYSLNFDQEFDEWQNENYGEKSNSLFKVYYKNYIESVFNAAKRMFKVTAYLPTKVTLNLRLNDQIRIQGKIFRINSISTNLNTGKSELELLNIFSNEIVE